MLEILDLHHPDGAVRTSHPLTLPDTLDAAAGTLRNRIARPDLPDRVARW